MAGGGYAAFLGLSGGSADKAAKRLPLCPAGTIAKAARLRTAPLSKITVDNAALVTGLAATVAGELRHRGFPIGTIGNAAAVGEGVATITYSPDRRVEALELASQFSGAALRKTVGRRVVELDLNPDFSSLVTVDAAERAFRLATVRANLATARPSASPACRPHS